MAGCGGGSSTSAPTGAATVAGKVADGYLAGATVFMDKNGNYQLDAGEPFATTDDNGVYTLSVDPADIGKYPIVAMAVKGVTVDGDTGQAVASSYVMSMPKDAVSGTVSSNFISPMSSQVREMMETGKYATMQQAMDALAAKLGMPAGANMLADYIATRNGSMHTAAQNMASLMGGQMPMVFGNNSSARHLDVNRYRGMMGAIFSNMSTVKSGGSQSMTDLMTTMTSNLNNIQTGQPFRNMSSSFSGMMGGTVSGGGMMGTTSGTGGSSTGTGGSMMGR